jgi:hypothetical protein
VNICENLFTFDDGTSKEPCKSSIINGEELNTPFQKNYGLSVKWAECTCW